MKKVIKVERFVEHYFCDVCGEELFPDGHYHCSNCRRDLCKKHIKDLYTRLGYCPLCMKVINIKNKKEKENRIKVYILLNLIKILYNRKIKEKY